MIAMRRPDVQLTLVERRISRADLLRRAVRALGVERRTEVVAGDVRAVGGNGRRFEVVTARSFAAPAQFARVAAPLCTPGGIALVSEPPADEHHEARWSTALLDATGWSDEGAHDGIRQLRRR